MCVRVCIHPLGYKNTETGNLSKRQHAQYNATYTKNTLTQNDIDDGSDDRTEQTKKHGHILTLDTKVAAKAAAAAAAATATAERKRALAH